MLVIILEIIKIICVLALSFISTVFFIGGFRVISTDKADYKRNHKPINSIAYDLNKQKVVTKSTLPK
jgi:hypothetical protein